MTAIVLLAACASASSGDAKIEATLRSALDDPTSTSRPLPFEVESNGIVPVFVRTKDPAKTAAAIVNAGGTTSTFSGGIITARIPMERIRRIAARDEVVSIEPSFKLR